MIVDLDKVIKVLIEEGYLKGYDIIEKDISGKIHGPCCYCMKCRYPHDECVCNHNNLLKKLKSLKITCHDVEKYYE